MDERRANLMLMRRLRHLARTYVSIARLSLLDHYDDFESGARLTAQQTHEMLRSAFTRSHVDDLGLVAAARLLRRVTRRHLVTRYAVRTLVLGSIPVLLIVHGPWKGVVLQAALYAFSRPLVWTNRTMCIRLTERILNKPGTEIAAPRALRRSLRRDLGVIPARAITSTPWGAHIRALLPGDETTREIAIKLADQYTGPVAELIDTSRALAR